jgi:hypothetical protein
MEDTGRRLYSEDMYLYSEDSPVIIGEGYTERDGDGNILAVFKFINIGDKVIKALLLQVTPLDAKGNKFAGILEFPYQDLNIQRDVEFGGDIPFFMPEGTATFSARVTEVNFQDNSSWYDGGKPWAPLSTVRELSTVLHDEQLIEQYKKDFGPYSEYVPQIVNDLWFCTCGSINHVYEQRCHFCKNNYNKLVQAMNPEKLRQEIYIGGLNNQTAQTAQTGQTAQAGYVNNSNNSSNNNYSNAAYGTSAGANPYAQSESSGSALKAGQGQTAGTDSGSPIQADPVNNGASSGQYNENIQRILEEQAAQRAAEGTNAGPGQDAAMNDSSNGGNTIDAIMNETAEAPKKKRSKAPAIITVIVVILALAAGAIFYGLPMYKIKQGDKKLAQGNYDGAISEYSALRGYMGSNDKIKEANYQHALALLKEKDYTSAIAIFNTLGNYKDSQKQAADSTNEKNYKFASKKLEDGDLNGAIDAFSQIGDYKDSAEKLLEAKYTLAGKLFDGGSFEDAYSAYKELADAGYKDSADKVTECLKKIAYAAYQDGDYKEAAEYYEQLGDDITVNICKSKYVKSHMDAADETTKQYLLDLKAASYPNADKLYNKLFAIHYRIVVNTDPKSAREAVTAADNADKLYLHYKVVKGATGDAIKLNVKIVQYSTANKSTMKAEKYADGQDRQTIDATSGRTWNTIEFPACSKTEPNYQRIRVAYLDEETGHYKIIYDEFILRK